MSQLNSATSAAFYAANLKCVISANPVRHYANSALPTCATFRRRPMAKRNVILRCQVLGYRGREGRDVDQG